MKKLLIALLVTSLMAVSTNTSEASNWHTGYKYHDNSLGFDIYWKWGDLMDIKHDMISIRVVSSVAMSELCAYSLTDVKEGNMPGQVQMNMKYMNFNGLPRYSDTAELVFVEDQYNNDQIQGVLLNNGKILKTSIYFARCDDPYPNFGVTLKSKFSYPTWNGINLVK